jgi:hypothetical protein
MIRNHFLTPHSDFHPAPLPPLPSAPTLRLLALLVLLGGLVSLSIVFSQEGSEPHDSLSFRWKSLSPEQTAPEMERLRRGELVQMSRVEFEEKLRQARIRVEQTVP